MSRHFRRYRGFSSCQPMAAVVLGVEARGRRRTAVANKVGRAGQRVGVAGSDNEVGEGVNESEQVCFNDQRDTFHER